MTKIEELMNDFESAVEKIDFEKYSPMSEEFNRALKIGTMLHLMTLYSDSEHTNIYEELADAEKYTALYKETGNDVYKKMADDEMLHAQMLMKIAASKDGKVRESAPPTAK